MDQPCQDGPEPHSLRKRCVRVFMRCLCAVLLLIGLYLLIVLIGLIPVNNDFEPSPDGIEILLISGSVHADVILPIDSETINWREHFPAECFSGDTSGATHAAIGWGDKGFFIETPTWADLRISTAAKALLWPSDSAMHVYLTTAESLPEGTRSVTISAAQYERLVQHINKGFRHEADGSKIPITDAAYGPRDAFFEAHGTYHCFNTCNCWAGGAMKSAGIRTGWFTPLPKTMFLYLPK